MEFKQKEALRYLRAKPGDKAAEILVDTVYLKLRNEVQARYILQKHAITADEAGVTLDCGVRFHSRALARHLKGCDTVLLGCNTRQQGGCSHPPPRAHQRC